MLLFSPAQFPAGGGAANISPARAHSTGHALTVTLTSGAPASKTGLGSPPVVAAEWKESVEGSIAQDHVELVVGVS